MAATSPTSPRTMLIRNTGRQSSPAMLAEMMNPAAIGPEDGGDPHGRTEGAECAGKLGP